MTNDNIVEILAVEDNPEDLELMLRALRKSNLGNRIQVARDGAEALDYIFCTGTHANRTIDNLPKVVLLDLETAESGRLGSAGEDQVRFANQEYSRGRSHFVQRTEGHCGELSARREQLHR